VIYDVYIFLLIDTFSFQGTKYVIKQVPNTRKQFLIMDGEAIIAFVEKGTKFGQCAEYMDITSKIQCKDVESLNEVDLTATPAADPGM